jgi:DNA recombination protein RmuC
MKTLAQGVGDLQRVLSNVKTRGIFGEVQLEALLEQVLTIEQYSKQVETKPRSNQRVDFAIKLPGRSDDGAAVWLPIDAKFPREDYERLLDAQDRADVAGAEGFGVGADCFFSSGRAKIRFQSVAIRTTLHPYFSAASNESFDGSP